MGIRIAVLIAIQIMTWVQLDIGFAQNGGSRDGGDPEEIRFQTAATELVKIYDEMIRLKKSQVEPFASLDFSAFSLLGDSKKFMELVRTTRVTGVPSESESLSVVGPNGEKVSRKATNLSSDRSIHVDQNYCRTASLQDPAFLGFVFHEYLGIEGLDRNYEISHPLTTALNHYFKSQISATEQMESLLFKYHSAVNEQYSEYDSREAQYRLLMKTSDYDTYLNLKPTASTYERIRAYANIAMIVGLGEWEMGVSDLQAKTWQDRNQSYLNDLIWIQSGPANQGGCKKVNSKNRTFCQKLSETIDRISKVPSVTSTPVKKIRLAQDAIDQAIQSNPDRAQAIQFLRITNEYTDNMNKIRKDFVQSSADHAQEVKNTCMNDNSGLSMINHCIFNSNISTITDWIPSQVKMIRTSENQAYEEALNKLRNN